MSKMTQIERTFGVRYLASAPQIFPNDEEIFTPAKEFMFTCLKYFKIASIVLCLPLCVQ